GTGKAQSLLAGDLGDGAVGRQVALQDLDVPGRLQRVGERTHDRLPRRETWQLLHVLTYRAAGHGEAVAVQQPLVEEHAHHGRDPADGVKILHDVRAARLEVGQERHAVAHALKI